MELNKTGDLRPSAPAYWQNRWLEGRTGWDLGGLHPLFPELWEQARSAGLPELASIVEPGCGRAHTSAALAKIGFKATAFDVSAEAIAAAKSVYGGQQDLQLVVADLFHPPQDWAETFDAVYDRAVLCALPSDVRSAYIQTCASLLKRGGLFLSIAFTKLHITEAEGPPFAVAEENLTVLLRNQFEKVYHRETVNADKDSKIAVELVAVWQKK